MGNFIIDNNGRLLIVGGTAPKQQQQASSKAKGGKSRVSAQDLPATIQIPGIKSVVLHYADGTELFHVDL